MNDKEKLLRDYGRMCLTICEDGNCGTCPVKQLNLDNICQRNLAENHLAAIEVIERWAKEHPVKTRQDEFLERYPNVTTNFNGVIDIDPCKIDTSLLKEGLLKGLCKIVEDCRECRDYYWSQEVEQK